MAGRIHRKLAVGGALLLAGIACNLTSRATPAPGDLEQVQTAVAGTLMAQLTLTMGPGPAAGQPTVPPANTPEPLPSPTITLTPTDTSTPTPSVPMVSVTVNTNCRFGPGAVYDYLGALLVGESAEIVGRDPSGEYWYIRNPDNPSGFCWLWGEYAVVVGSFGSLPILTPPPSPTPTYTPTATTTYTPTP
jgi:hypothetical protein